MKLYRLDVKICGTAYIVADNPARAKALVQEELQDAFLDAENTSLFTGVSFERLLEGGEGVTLSPAMTCYGAWSDVVDSDLEDVSDD
jgi:hypothetical protein